MPKKNFTPGQGLGPSAKQRSARLKFVKKNKSLTVEKGRNDNLFLDQWPKYIVSAA